MVMHGGNLKLKESARQLERFAWRQKKPLVERRLDFWFIDNALQGNSDQVDIIPSIKSDHLAIVLIINSTDGRKSNTWSLLLEI